ncbi:MAG TPA: sigma factor-like helix-turn-helix DNA-binding protein [Streptosporangiaceae bacterium]|nr:sigma factor-like helix-turn-helix DNA-binding protein [Streptosporangiaceae bacterium]
MGLNREHAEAHLRLVAEGELCRAATFPQAAAAAALYGLPRRQREVIALQHYARLPEYETARAIGLSVGAVKAHTTRGMAALQTALEADTSRVAGIAQVLTAVGALDDGVADQILRDFALALGIRRAGPAARRSPDPGSLLRSSAVHVPLTMLMSCQSVAAAAARSAGPGTAPYRAVPVGQMIPVRGEGEGVSGETEDVTGEIHVLSYTRTAFDAWLTVAARTRGEFVPPGIEPSCRYRPYATFPVHQFAATDDRGTRYQMGFRGRGERRPSELTGQIILQPSPPPGIRWLDLATVPGEPAVRIDLNRPPDDTEMTLRPPAASPGEHLLNTIAMRLLLLVLEFPQEIRLHPVVPLPEPFACIADGLSDTIAALQACGALSPLSLVPGHLAALCTALNVAGHGITAPPTRDLPGPWLSMLTHYRRRKQRTAGDGCAAVAAAFPELDGIRLTIVGLHNSADRTVLFVQAAGVTPDGYDGRLGVDLEFPLRIWVRDSSGRWHATRADGWAGADHNEVTMRLQVLPPLSRAAAWIDVLAAGHSAEVRVTLPLRWQ